MYFYCHESAGQAFLATAALKWMKNRHRFESEMDYSSFPEDPECIKKKSFRENSAII